MGLSWGERQGGLSGLLHQCFPKGTYLSSYNAEHLAQVAEQLNGRPRRVPRLVNTGPSPRYAYPKAR
jgi:hypothetical protein